MSTDRPPDAALNIGAPDALTACDNLEAALVLVIERGSFTAAQEHAEKKAAQAIARDWSTRYRWAGIARAMRRAEQIAKETDR